MRHQKSGKKFGRVKGQRNAFVKGLVSNLFQKGKITTTETRAKMLKKEAEKMITLGKKQQTSSLRLLISRLPKKSAEKVFYEISPKYMERKGGYIRVTKLSARRIGDRSKMARVELV